MSRLSARLSAHFPACFRSAQAKWTGHCGQDASGSNPLRKQSVTAATRYGSARADFHLSGTCPAADAVRRLHDAREGRAGSCPAADAVRRSDGDVSPPDWNPGKNVIRMPPAEGREGSDLAQGADLGKLLPRKVSPAEATVQPISAPDEALTRFPPGEGSGLCPKNDQKADRRAKEAAPASIGTGHSRLRAKKALSSGTSGSPALSGSCKSHPQTTAQAEEDEGDEEEKEERKKEGKEQNPTGHPEQALPTRRFGRQDAPSLQFAEKAFK